MEGKNEEKFLKEIEEVVQRATMDALKKQEEQKRTKLLYNTRILMESYREMKRFIETAISEEEELEENIYQILKGESSTLRSVRSAKMQTAMMIANIDRSLAELQQDYRERGALYKFDAFRMKYVEGRTFEQISEALGCGKNSPNAWCKAVMKQMSIKLFGVCGIFQI